MDLTKIVLPTFILERRSLLEMFADFFSHPDLFVRIGDYSTPEQRMTEVMRWYMSGNVTHNVGQSCTDMSLNIN